MDWGSIGGFALNPMAAVGSALGMGQGLMNLYGQREQRKWEENMANSAYQRASADMQKAGLNPALMWGKGGAADTPNVAPPQFENPMDTISGVASLMQTQRQMEMMDKQMSKIDVDSNYTAAQTEALNIANNRERLTLGNWGKRLELENRGLSADARSKEASARSTEWQTPEKEFRGTFFKRLNSWSDDLNSARDRLDAEWKQFIDKHFKANNDGRGGASSARTIDPDRQFGAFK